MAVTFTLGTQFEVDTNGGLARVAPLTNVAAIALFSSAASGVEARHVTNSGGTLTGGSVLTIDANQADSITICRLSNTSAVIGYAYGSTHVTRVLTVSGTTLTANTAKNMTDTGVDYLTCDFLDTDKIIYCYADSTADGQARILSITGTTVAEGSAFTFESTDTVIHCAVKSLNTLEAIVAWGDSGGDPYAEVLDISGTTVTGNTHVSVSNVAITTTGHSSLDISQSVSDSDFAVVTYMTPGGASRFQLLSNSGGTLTRNAGAPGLLIESGAAGRIVNCCTAVSISNTSGADPGYDLMLYASNITDDDNLSLREYDNWFGAVDTDTSISTTDAVTSEIHARLFPGTTIAIVVWNASTEAITVSFPSSAFTGQRALVEDIDEEAGATIYLTSWEDGTLYLYNRLLSDLSEVTKASFGAASSSELTSRSKYIAPYTPLFPEVANFGDYVYAYGRWDDGSVKHLALSTAAGATGTFGSNLGDATWGSDWVGAFIADDESTFYAFVNGSSRALWRSVNGGSSWTSLSSLPFDVDPGGAVKHPDGRILIVNRIAASQMVALAQPPDYATWADVTGNPPYPTGGGGSRSIKWVV